MSISFINAAALSISTADATPAYPTGVQTGDMLILLAGSDNQAIIAPTSSIGGTIGNRLWTEIGNSANQGTGTAGTGATSARLGVFYRFATGSSEVATTLTDTGNITTGRMFALRGVDSSNPIVTSSAAVQVATTADPSFPSVTTNIDDAFFVFALQTGRDANNTNNFTSLTNTNLQNITEQIDEVANTGNGGGFAMWTATSSSSLNIGTSTAAKTTTWSDGISMMTIALRPKRRMAIF